MLRGRGIQERFEASSIGRGLLSLAIGFTLLAIAVTNLPDSELRRRLSDTTQPYLNAIGLDQNWGVFAPNPRSEVIALEARITYRDGAVETWKPPVHDALIGSYSDYRWQKFMENVIGDGGPGFLTESTAGWVVRERRGRSEPPLKVALIKRVARLAPPGPMADDELVFVDSQLIDLRVTRRLLRREAR